jgi:membrane associated rhomboid family serine protease
VIPLKDENPTSRPAVVTLAIVIACIGIWFFVQEAQPDRRVIDVGGGQVPAVAVPGDLAFNLEWAAIPCEVVEQEPLDLREIVDTFQGGDTEACESGNGSPELFPDKPIVLSMLVSMFLHGGLLHLGSNLLYLWIFGNNVEDRLGHVGYLLFYVVGGLVATLAHVAVNADSTVPLVGASGAIAAVMGAYLVWHPNARINTLVMMIFITFVQVRAKWLLGFWFVLQFFTGPDSGVAWVAHVGGFVFGVVAGLLIGPGGRHRRAPRHAIGDPYWRT